jgi:3-deoxy-manno-octulosonate cytidylyltransferase (CMP-KDO synthetase)
MPRIIVLIPARYQSSRFPGKPLSKIHGKSMIQRVFENCASSGYESYVVTDDARIEQHVKDFGGKVIRVDDDVPSGTERIALAFEREIEGVVDLVINVQGDEPLLRDDAIKELAEIHLKSNFDIMTMVKRKASGHEDFKNPNVVKAMFVEQSNQCLYFSRASIPFDRDGECNFDWFHHLGVYSYRPKALLEFSKRAVSRLENIEKLEQLRALEMGLSIGALEVNFEPIGVDTPADIHKIEEVIRE